MTKKLQLILLAVLLFSFSDILFGQNKIDGFSISPKLGAFLKIDPNDPAEGFMLGIEANVLKNQFLYSINYYYANEWIITGSGPDRYFNQSALLFGRYNTFNFFRLEYQAGLAVLWGIKYTEYHSEGFLTGYHDTEDFISAGLTMEIGGEFILSKYYSMGTHIQINLNKEMPTIGFVLSFSFGKIKE